MTTIVNIRTKLAKTDYLPSGTNAIPLQKT